MKRTTSPARATKETMLTIGILGLRATPYIVAYNVFLCIPVGLLLGPVAFGIASFVCTVATGIWLGRKFQRGAWPRSRSLPRHLTGVCVALAVTGSVATAGSASVAPTEASGGTRFPPHRVCGGAVRVLALGGNNGLDDLFWRVCRCRIDLHWCAAYGSCRKNPPSHRCCRNHCSRVMCSGISSMPQLCGESSQVRPG